MVPAVESYGLARESDVQTVAGLAPADHGHAVPRLHRAEQLVVLAESAGELPDGPVHLLRYVGNTIGDGDILEVDRDAAGVWRGDGCGAVRARRLPSAMRTGGRRWAWTSGESRPARSAW